MNVLYLRVCGEREREYMYQTTTALTGQLDLHFWNESVLYKAQWNVTASTLFTSGAYYSEINLLNLDSLVQVRG